MKSFFVAIGILAGLVVGGIVFNMSLNKTAETLLINCQQINEYIESGDFESAYKYTEETSEYIDKKKPLLSSILDHGNIDEIEKEISELLGYTQKGDSVNSVVSIKELEHMMEHLPENYALRLQNIL